MPALPQPTPLTWKARLVLVGVTVALGYGFYREPRGLFLIATLTLVCWAFGKAHHHSMARLAAARPGESICTFARSFEWRHTDPWILRAVYEELSAYISPKGLVVPIRRGDRWKEDLEIGGDDLNEFLVYGIACRANRSMDYAENNPLFGKVHTVGDLVRFLQHQPRGAMFPEPCLR